MKDGGKFYDLEVLKRSVNLCADIYKAFTNTKDFGFKNQITRAGLSIPSNIAEKYERESNKINSKFSQICNRFYR